MATEEANAPVVAEEASHEEAAAGHWAMAACVVEACRDAPEGVPVEVVDACDSWEAAEEVAMDPPEPASDSHRPTENCCTHEQQPGQRPLDRRSPLPPLLFCPVPNPGRHLRLVWKR